MSRIAGLPFARQYHVSVLNSRYSDILSWPVQYFEHYSACAYKVGHVFVFVRLAGVHHMHIAYLPEAGSGFLLIPGRSGGRLCVLCRADSHSLRICPSACSHRIQKLSLYGSKCKGPCAQQTFDCARPMRRPSRRGWCVSGQRMSGNVPAL